MLPHDGQPRHQRPPQRARRSARGGGSSDQGAELCPNRAARSLAGAGQIRIALLYTNPSAAYLSALLLGCLDEASRADVHLVVERCAFGEDEEKAVKRQMAGGIDGFLLPPPLCDETSLLDLLHGLKAPAVQIGPARPTLTTMP
jgi:LacI family transcriptional regulator